MEIKWKAGKSGTFSTAADWAGGIAPGNGDTALIAATGKYTVTVNAQTDVAALVLDSANATVALESGLSAAAIMLEAGHLLLDNGSNLSGTITELAGAIVSVARNSGVTLNDVTWIGALKPVLAATDPGTFVVSNGLTLLASDGSAPGSASFGNVTFNDVASLNNASIVFTGPNGIVVENTPTLTLGSGLTLTGDLFDTAGAAIINNGMLTAAQAAATGTFVNNGTLTVQELTAADRSVLTDAAAFGGASFTNNGDIIVTAGAHLALDVAALQAAGDQCRDFTTGRLVGIGGIAHHRAGAFTLRQPAYQRHSYGGPRLWLWHFRDAQ